MIEARNLSFSYFDRKALEDVDLVVKPGEFWGLIGPNGSGKSTLLKCLCGILAPQKGEVLLEGKPLGSYRRREIAQKIAMVPQESAFSLNFTAYEVVLLGRTPYLERMQLERTSDHEAVQRAMEKTDCWELKDRRIWEISGGERQRVVIARALAQSPRVLLLDEPTAHLDIAHQVEVYNLLLALNRKEGLTILAVSHDLNLAGEYCERVALMEKGRVRAVGDKREILSSGLLSKVYQQEVSVRESPATGEPHVFLVPHKEKQVGR
jgi:iron complex transport system ATP-binding protein